MEHIPLLGLGTVQHYTQKGAITQKILDAFDIGYRHIDTATNYGTTDEVREAIRRLKVPRKEYWVTVKLSSGARSLKEVQEAVQSFGLEYADLVLLHYGCGTAKSLAVLEEAQRVGLARHIGTSNCYELPKTKGPGPGIYANQIELHPYAPEMEIMKMYNSAGVGIIAYAPLATGAVGLLEILAPEKIAEIKDKYDFNSYADMFLLWNIQRMKEMSSAYDIHNSTLTGASSRSNLEKNYNLAYHNDIVFTPAEMKTMSCLSRWVFCDEYQHFTTANPALYHRKGSRTGCGDEGPCSRLDTADLFDMLS